MEIARKILRMKIPHLGICTRRTFKTKARLLHFCSAVRNVDARNFRKVEITKGEDKGKQGTVEEVVRETGSIYVSGLNLRYDVHETGEIISTSASLCLDKSVSLIDPGDEKPTRVQWQYTDTGEKIRVSVRTGRQIPLPASYYDVHEDGTYKPSFKATMKDTREAEVTKKTFVPSTLTFEEDLMQKLNIKEDRKKTFKTYWY